MIASVNRVTSLKLDIKGKAPVMTLEGKNIDARNYSLVIHQPPLGAFEPLKLHGMRQKKKKHTQIHYDDLGTRDLKAKKYLQKKEGHSV